ncbi:Nitrilase family, member 2 [Seminavis robusta]|uniref:Nitrilase family, member 2 n=1 Tax=Seminavis robusta TaxID=568900 RepID=A0A9N8DHX8_9STRA|nr:Nitrilase family, member 2 [Seminavis robusta]|eukprot:Sro152_g069580.1 Nitrilase family, member 2 (285) ;mRNA; f:89167-90271
MVDRGMFVPAGQWPQNESIAMSESEDQLLPRSFHPDSWTVVCGRGRECYDHTGNRRLRVLVDAYVDRYVAAINKMQKSLIVSSIVDSVHEASSSEGFVKRDPATNYWVTVSEDTAREKVGQLLRDAIAKKYPKRAKAKKEMRRAKAETGSQEHLPKLLLRSASAPLVHVREALGTGTGAAAQKHQESEVCPAPRLTYMRSWPGNVSNTRTFHDIFDDAKFSIDETTIMDAPTQEGANQHVRSKTRTFHDIVDDAKCSIDDTTCTGTITDASAQEGAIQPCHTGK